MSNTVPFTDLQTAVWQDRYRLEGESSWQDTAHRVCDYVGDNPSERKEFYEVIEPMYFLPGGRNLFAMGNPAKVTPYNCFVLPSPEDSRSGIVDSLGQWIEIQARGGGVGINMSSLRPSGAVVAGVNGTSSGPLAWMELFSTATHRVIQQGGSRRGAAMLILDDSHPDIFDFIMAKRQPGILLGANLSVNVSDRLMEAVRTDSKWELSWKGELYRTIRARDLWSLIMESAWSSGEPGVVFLERANKESNSWYCETLVATNPCAEQPLGPFAVCLLGSINLAKFTNGTGWKVDELHRVTSVAVRFLDNVIDRAYYPLPESEIVQKRLRRLGIGTMGLADALIQMGIRYGSDEAVEATESVFRMINKMAYLTSANQAWIKGAFPDFDRRWLESLFVRRMGTGFTYYAAENGIRNCFLTSQAPTGTIAKLANVWAGIEPYFDKDTFLTNRLGNHQISAPDSPYLVTANEVSPAQHIAMMAAAQRHVDSAVSKTVNAPKEHRVQDTEEVYQLAYDAGCKSVAYYRDKSRSTQVQWRDKKDAQLAIKEWEAPIESPLECKLGESVACG